MYIPPFNEEKRLPVIHDLMRAHPLATLITMTEQGLFATHLPLVLHADEGEFGSLRGHISKANLQGRSTNADVDALVIFAGPHHYISPNWYPTKLDDHKTVPTWNYAVVHAYAPITFHEDAAWLLTHLETLTTIHEAASLKPWKLTDAPAGYIAGQAKGIVGIELPIRSIEGKWKVSQNRNAADRDGVVRGLDDLATPEAAAMSALIPGAK
jgi:transcriptional regulator